MKKLVFGHGHNDMVNMRKTREYRKWHSMLRRCYDPKSLEKYPTYIGCSVSTDWLLFSNFYKDMQENKYWNLYPEYHLDKDILFPENKVYSKETCVLVPHKLNYAITTGRNASKDSDLPIGVCFVKNRSKSYQAHINLNSKLKSLGYFSTPEEASKAYLKTKQQYINDLCDEYQDKVDPRVIDKLKTLYVNMPINQP